MVIDVAAWAVTVVVVTGVTALDTVLVAPTPIRFVVLTVNVYEVPLVNPVAIVEVEVVVAAYAAGLEMTV